MSRRLSISRFSLPPAGDLVDQLSKIEFIEPTGAQQFGLDLRPGEKIPGWKNFPPHWLSR